MLITLVRTSLKNLFWSFNESKDDAYCITSRCYHVACRSLRRSKLSSLWSITDKRHSNGNGCTSSGNAADICLFINLYYIISLTFNLNTEIFVKCFYIIMISIWQENLEALDTNNDGEVSLKEFAGANNLFATYK